MDTPVRRERWRRIAAFAIIYFVWGSTFLAIRVGVREVPPFLFASMRFLLAGMALCGWMIARGEPMPTRREWLSASLLGFVIFVLDYGSLFWAEQRVPSGVAAVMLATIPAFMALSEILFLRTQKLTLRLALGLSVGLAGVAVLVSRSGSLGGEPVDRAGAWMLLLASLSWSAGSVLARKLALPAAKVMSSGAQMMAGGVFLLLAAAALGEFHRFHLTAVSRGAWLSLLYLVVAGSIIGFTAYVWLLHHESPTKVGTYAYVNPAVAVLIGYFFAGEALGFRTVCGTVFILVSVIVITTLPGKDKEAAVAKDGAEAAYS